MTKQQTRMTTVTMGLEIRSNQFIHAKIPEVVGSLKTGNFPRWVAEVVDEAAKVMSFIDPETIIIIIDLLLKLSIFLNIQKVHNLKHPQQKIGQQRTSLPRTFWPSIERSPWMTKLMEMILE